MSQVAKWLDPVLGIDIHVVLVPVPPAPPIPVPLPHPFIGIVFDPLGALMGAAIGLVFSGGGPVLINMLPVGNTGTNVKAIPHFPMPPGTAFAPFDVPGNEGVIVTGSKTVTMAGASAGRMGSLVMSCNFPINLPTSVCLAVPMGPPVIVGGPDSFDILAALTQAIRTKWVSGKLHALFNAKPGSWRSKIICFLTGHPVDVVSGQVLTDGVDFALPGPIPLKWERNYYSRSEYAGPLGLGWHHPFDASVYVTDDGLVLRLPDGRQDWQPLLEDGESVWAEVERYRLQRLGSSFVLTTWDGLQSVFEPVTVTAPQVYRLRRLRDRCGNKIELAYERGQLTSFVDSEGRQLCLRWTGAGRLASIAVLRMPAHRWETLVEYQYNAAGQLSAAVDPRGNAYRYEYRGNVLTKETNRNGLSFYFEYDWYSPAGWCIRTWGDGGIYDRRLTYDKLGRMTIVEDSRGGRTHYYGNAAGLVDRKVDAVGGQWQWQWDKACRKTAEVDPSGNRTDWQHDEWGNVVSRCDALGNSIHKKYNHRLSEFVDALGGTWKFFYDDRDLVIQIINPQERSARYSWDRFGRLLRAEKSPGEVLTIDYRDSINTKEITLANGVTVSLLLDDLGRLVQRSATDGKALALTWQSERLVRATTETGYTQAFDYDPEGNIIAQADSRGAVIYYEYAGFNRLAKQRDAEGGVTTYSYDTEENLTAIVNPVGEECRFSYDLVDNLLSETGFDGATYRYVYDGATSCQQMTDPLGTVWRYTYDALGQVIKRTATPFTGRSQEVAEYSYDANGLMIAAQNDIAKVALTRDSLGRVISEQCADFQVFNEYGAAEERLRRSTSLGHTTEFKFERSGLLARLAISAADLPPADNDSVWSYRFDTNARGNEQCSYLPGNLQIQTTTVLEKTGRLTTRSVVDGPFPRLASWIRWNSEGLPETISGFDRTTTQYVHNRSSELVSAASAAGAVEYRSRDLAHKIYTSPACDDRRYGQGGRLQAALGTSYYHDAKGQLIKRVLPDGSIWLYKWDAMGQLRDVLSPAGHTVHFDYDALGRRVSKTVGARQVRYLWDGNDLLHEVDNHKDLVTWEFKPNTFSLIAKIADKSCFSCVSDQVGAPAAFLSEAGEVVWQAKLDILGNSTADGVDDFGCPWRWPGHYHDQETGLNYNRFRYYDPDSGIYISQDPIGIAGGLNPYNYVPCPLTYVDLFGLLFGLYEFIDNGLPYIGSSVDTFRRLGEHVRDSLKGLADRSLAQEIAVEVFDANKTEARGLLRLAEQEAIEAAGGLIKLTNSRNALVKNRKFYEELRDWYKNGKQGDKPKINGCK